MGEMKNHFIKWDDPPKKMEYIYSERARNKKMTDWQKLRAKLAQRPGQWALIRITDKRPVITPEYHKGLEIAIRQFKHRRTMKYGTWARIPASNEDTVKTDNEDLTEGTERDSI